MAEAKVAKVVQAAPKATKVRVVATNGPFVDLHTDTIINDQPIEIELTGWLQANIDQGLLLVCS